MTIPAAAWSSRFVRLANDGQRGIRFAVPVFLLIDLAVPMNGEYEVLRQRVNDRNANTMKAAGYLVGIVVKFTAGVQDGHDDLGSRSALFRVLIDRDTAPVVRNRDRFIGVNGHRNDVTMAGQGLVNRVIDNLENHVV
jgi:hypothetical protein